MLTLQHLYFATFTDSSSGNERGFDAFLIFLGVVDASEGEPSDDSAPGAGSLPEMILFFQRWPQWLQRVLDPAGPGRLFPTSVYTPFH
jgi:hypothetical protein